VLLYLFLPLATLLLFIVNAIRAEGVIPAKEPGQPVIDSDQRSLAGDRPDVHELRNRLTTKRPPAETVELFEQHCASCHGGDGRGVEAKVDFPTIPNFAEISWQQSRSEAQLTASVINGRGDGMPPFGEELSRTQITALVNHIRWFAPAPVDQPVRRKNNFSRKYALLKQEWEALVLELAELKSRD
jgi:hypothetical protein